MYPRGELSQLAAHKAALRRRIAVDRTRCAVSLARVMRPFAWLDGMLMLGRRLSRLLRRVPLGILVQRVALPRWKRLGSLLAWSPLVFDVVRALRSATRPSVRVSRPSDAPAGRRG